MSGKEKLPKLVAVHDGQEKLGRRQIPLSVEPDLTLVMDVKGSGIVCDGPTLKSKEVEKFQARSSMLTADELYAALQITKAEMMQGINQNVPCVGCRRSVERLYGDLLEEGHSTLEPLIVRSDGLITIRQEKIENPSVLSTIFHQHKPRLSRLIENQPKKNKKSNRCILHSLESQKSRPLTPVWCEVWNSMKIECKKAVCLISAEGLHNTLENYLRKHRFCGECRTKVLKAYNLLVEAAEPQKEKGYVPQLYSGIKRCIDEKEEKKHIHLSAKTEYITKLISRAEPELLGSRRERHAKTIEIAQEEVLTCLGIFIYERLHHIYWKMREEERTCQLFAAVAIDALCQSFEVAVEKKQGVSKLELLYAEITREEQLKQIRKEQKKMKRKRKKGKSSEHDHDCKDSNNEDDDEDEKDDLDKECTCTDNKCESLMYCSCEQYASRNGTGCFDDYPSHKEDKARCTNDVWECKCENKENNKENVYKCDRYLSNGSLKKESHGSSSDHSHDCGYSSENNNGCCETGSLISSLSSTPDGSELACSDTCCHPDADYISHCRLTYGGNASQPSLQEMLEEHSDEEDCDCYITPEEVKEFKSKSRQVNEIRQELRETLQKRFAQFCQNGPLEVPRLLIQTKYASN